MYIYELFKGINLNKILKYITENHPVYLSDNFINLKTTMDEKAYNTVLSNSKKTIENTLAKLILMSREEITQDSSIVMVVVPEINPDKNDETTLASYLIEKNNVLENKDNLILWSMDDTANIKRFGYNFIPWDEVLSYEICPKSLELSKEILIGEIFCELTRFGFDESHIEHFGSSLSQDLDGINLNEEIDSGRHKKYNRDSWFDKLCDKIGLSKAPVEYYDDASERKIIIKNNHRIHLEYLSSIK